MNGRSGTRWLLIAAGAIPALLAICGMGLVVLSAAGAGGAAEAEQASQGSTLRPDAPIPPQYLAYVMQAGSLCPLLGPAEVAAQIDLESSWNPNAVAHNPPDRGGDAMGIAQFQAATWQTWGGDVDHDGQNSPYDPEDASVALGRLMCDNIAWAQQMLATQPPRLRGTPLDLAWAAYFAGRGAILTADGIPASGATHHYPQQVRARLPRYAADTGGDGLPNGGSGGIPAGYVPPSNAQQAAAVSFALAQLGKPYVFGAEGPNAYDCSGLVMAAWAHAGVTIPRTTADQVHTGVGVYSLNAMQPGDLIFIPGSNGTMSRPGHVGMYIGRDGAGRRWLVQAPHTGDHVKTTAVDAWRSIAAIRRPVTR
jgi:cell wall-associated NlpC family hydrolase